MLESIKTVLPHPTTVSETEDYTVKFKSSATEINQAVEEHIVYEGKVKFNFDSKNEAIEAAQELSDIGDAAVHIQDAAETSLDEEVDGYLVASE